MWSWIYPSGPPGKALGGRTELNQIDLPPVANRRQTEPVKVQ